MKLMTKRRFFLCLALVAVIGCLVYVFLLREEQDDLELVTARKADLAKTLSLRCRSNPIRQSVVTAAMAGTLHTVLVDLDQEVQAGQKIAVIELSAAVARLRLSSRIRKIT